MNCNCGQRAEPGRRRCRECREYAADWMRDRYDIAIANGICPRCRKSQLPEGFSSCRGCRVKRSRKQPGAVTV